MQPSAGALSPPMSTATQGRSAKAGNARKTVPNTATIIALPPVIPFVLSASALLWLQPHAAPMP